MDLAVVTRHVQRLERRGHGFLLALPSLDLVRRPRVVDDHLPGSHREPDLRHHLELADVAEDADAIAVGDVALTRVLDGDVGDGLAAL